MYPDFIGIGAQKAGTTWLHRNLQAHPQIWTPRKEVHYFDRKIKDHSGTFRRFFGKRETDDQWRRQVKRALWELLRKPSTRDLGWAFKYYMRPYNDEWYASIFEPKWGKVAGEITPAYSALDRKRVAHIHGLMPDVKIVFFMRSPIERAWSQTVMSFDKQQKGSAETVSEKEIFEKLGRNSTWRLTNFPRTLENWGAFYPEDQIFVGFLEDVHFFPEELLGRLYSFLGVDPHFDPSLTGKKVHSRSANTMPANVAVHLARAYQEEISWLEERFGGYASFWNFCARRLVEDPPEEESVPYPLYESRLWEEWTGGDSLRQVQSGPLASVRVAG